MNPASDLVNKLWRLCAVLRKDGITYQQYVTELTYLLFLKMMAEQKREEGRIPEGMRWRDLATAEGVRQLSLYRAMLTRLGDPEKPLDRTVQAIFANAATFIREPVNLDRLVTAIDDLHWFSEERDSFGDLYEGLLQKNAEETKRGAGQYFTPRVLIGVLVRLVQPKPGEIIQDPAAGTGGFLIAAERAIRAMTDEYFALAPKAQEFQLHHALHGQENVQGVYRLLLMNLFLHGIDSWHIDLGDTLSPDGAALPLADLILTNPPFGPAGGRPSRDDLTVTSNVSSYQLPFVEHCIRALKPRRPRRRNRPRQCAVRGRARPGTAAHANGPLQPAHDPATADRHILCAGRQDERDLLPQGRGRFGEHEGGVGIRSARQHAGLWQDDAYRGRAFRRIRGGLRCRPEWRGAAHRPGRRGPFPPLQPRRDRRPR